MIPEIKERMTDVAKLCRRYDVEELHLFGSATSAANIAEVGDLVEHDAIRNPYFRTAVEEQKEPLYGVS